MILPSIQKFSFYSINRLKIIVELYWTHPKRSLKLWNITYKYHVSEIYTFSKAFESLYDLNLWPKLPIFIRYIHLSFLKIPFKIITAKITMLIVATSCLAAHIQQIGVAHTLCLDQISSLDSGDPYLFVQQTHPTWT